MADETTEMADERAPATGPDPLLEEIDELADTARVRADAMRLSNGRWALGYVVTIAVLGCLLGYVESEVIAFTEPEHLAEVAGDIAIDRLGAIMERGRDLAKSNAPKFVKDAEEAVQHAVPEFRKTLEEIVRVQVNKAVADTLTAHDKALVEELRQLPEASKLIAAAASKPADADALYDRVHDLLASRSDVMTPMETTTAELIVARDNVRRLREVSGGLTPPERAERRLLQVVLAGLKMPPAPDVKAAPKTGKPK